MNPNIILAGRQPDFVNVLRQSTAGAQEANQVRSQNALRQLYQQQGPQIMAGEQGAMNALAQHDPMQAQQMNAQRAQMDQQAQAWKMRVAEYARGLTAEENAAEQRQIESGIKRAFVAFQGGDLAGVNAILQQAGEQPIQSLEQFPAVVSQYGDALTILKEVVEFGAKKPLSGPGKVQADIEAGLLPQGTDLRSPQVVVNTGDAVDPRPIVDKPQKGYQRRWDEEKKSYVDEPIPGNEVAREAAKDDKALELAASNYRQKAQVVDTNIDAALAMLDKHGRWVAGAGSLLSGIPETPAKDFNAKIETIKANLGFAELQAMRDASPTGGALGQVTERELAFLQAAAGNLDTAQSPEQLAEVLREIKTRRAEFAEERRRIMAGEAATQKVPDAAPDFLTEEDMGLWEYMTPEERAAILKVYKR